MGLSDEDVREILRIIDESQLDELRIDMDGFQLHVRRGGVPPAASVEQPPRRGSPPHEPERGAAPTPAASHEAGSNGVQTEVGATIAAPMLGMFYRASAPGEEPFVEVGSKVDPDTVVGLIEVMKMMNSVKAGVGGTVVEVCAANADLVEYGAPLFRVDPDA
jgi:acetyl-CoA carboxylase biotin carboxyl carrier protein